MGKIRTLRGQCNHDEVKHLIIDDGNFNHAFKVLEFKVLSIDPRTGNQDAWGTLATNENGASLWDLSDSRQIGWAGQTIASSDSPEPTMALIDPDHIVVRDLYVYGQDAVGQGFQYFIRLESVLIDDDNAIIALIKESSQDV